MTNVDNIDELFRRLSNTLTRPNPYVIRERDEETGAIREVEYDTARFGENYVTDAHTNPFPSRPGAPRYGVWRVPPQGPDHHGNRPFLLVTCSVAARHEYQDTWTGPDGTPRSIFYSAEIFYEEQEPTSTEYIFSRRKGVIEQDYITVRINLPHRNDDGTLTYDEHGLKNLESLVADWVRETPNKHRAMGTVASDACLFQCLTALHTRIGALEAVQTDWRYNVCYKAFRNGAQAPDEYVKQYLGRTYETAEEWWNTVVYRAVMDECAGLATPTSLSFGATGVAESECKPFRQLSGEKQAEFNLYFHNVHAFLSPLVINIYFY